MSSVQNYSAVPGTTDPAMQSLLADIMKGEMARQAIAAMQAPIPQAHMVPQQAPIPTPEFEAMTLQQGTIPQPFASPPVLPDASVGVPQSPLARAPQALPMPQPQMRAASQLAPAMASQGPALAAPQGSSTWPQVSQPPQAVPGMTSAATGPVQPQMPSVGTQMGQGLPPEIAPGPSRSSEEVQQRRAGWSSIVESFKTNPKLQMALLRLGTQLLQPVQPGQTPLGHFGNAVAGSMDYLSALQQQEVQQQHTQAQTGQLQAQTTTEGQRPAQVAAITEGTKTQTANVQQQTEEAKAMQGTKKRQAEELIQLHVKQGNLAQAQADELGNTLQRNPEYAEAVIAHLKAQAQAAQHPEAAHRATLQARAEFTKAEASRLLVANPELAALNKTNPELARAKAELEAGDRWFAVGATHDLTTQDAQSMFSNWEHDYQRLTSSGDKTVKGKSFDDFVMRKLDDPLLDAKLRAKLEVMRANKRTRQGPMQTPSGAGGRPPLSSFGKP